MMRMEIITNPYNKSNKKLYWIDDKGNKRGKGYLTKDYIGLIKCPMCYEENYAPNVPTGICSWCGFDANQKEISCE